MSQPPLLDDPATFCVWANVDKTKKFIAARHVARLYDLSAAQSYQFVAKAISENRKVEIFRFCGWHNANTYINEAPPCGFESGYFTVAEEGANLEQSPFCDEHKCYYNSECSVCNGDFVKYSKPSA